MAALFERHPVEVSEPRVLVLRQVRAEELERVLEEESQAWRRVLLWDLEPSADLVRRFVRMQALSGFALAVGGQVVGYTYYVCEERKGLIGDLYILRDHASIRNENLLLESVLSSLRMMPGLRRVESQLMMLDQMPDRPFPFPAHLAVHPREFMMADLAGIDRLLSGPGAARAVIEGWTDRRQEEAAGLIAEAYDGHIDANINDQYRTAPGARKFLLNIVQYPGCGSFFQPASFVALEPRSRRLVGISLASMVAAETGHITQICVHSEARGRQIGYEMLRASMQALAHHGCSKVSLTVTSANQGAIKLYEDVGFVKRRRFSASVWEW
jgi:ribosomal protein S18 acetylase RimI-like enzyme